MPRVTQPGSGTGRPDPQCTLPSALLPLLPARFSLLILLPLSWNPLSLSLSWNLQSWPLKAEPRSCRGGGLAGTETIICPPSQIPRSASWFWSQGVVGAPCPALPHARGVGLGDATGGAVLAVEAVLQVDLGFPNEVIGAYQIPVVYGYRQQGFHGEGGLNVKGPCGTGLGEGLRVGLGRVG